MARLSVAVLGCGRMGRIRVGASLEAGARVALAFDADLSRAEEVAGTAPGCVAADRLERIDWSVFDAVFVCTPPSDHVPLALPASSSGAALFIEKPLALTAAQAEPLLRAQADRGFPAAVGYMNRLRPSVRRLREMLAEATAALVSAHWSNAAYNVPWWADINRSGGPFREQGAHFVDLLTHLLGPVAEVRAIAAGDCALGSGARAAACLRFEGGALATFAYGAHSTAKTIGIHFFRTDGTLRLEGWCLDLLDSQGRTLVADGPDRNAIFFEETRLFLDGVAAGAPAVGLCTLAEALDTQRVIDRLGAEMDGAR